MCSVVWAYEREISPQIPAWISKEIPEHFDGNLFDEAAIFDLRNKKIAQLYKVITHNGFVYKIIINFLTPFEEYYKAEYACYCPSPKRENICLCEIKFVEMSIRLLLHDALCYSEVKKERFASIFRVDFAIFCEGKKLCRLETAPLTHIYERCPCFNLISCRWFDGYPLLCRIQNYLSTCPETDSEEEEVLATDNFDSLETQSASSDETLILDTGFDTDDNNNGEPELHCYEDDH